MKRIKTEMYFNECERCWGACLVDEKGEFVGVIDAIWLLATGRAEAQGRLYTESAVYFNRYKGPEYKILVEPDHLIVYRTDYPDAPVSNPCHTKFIIPRTPDLPPYSAEEYLIPLVWLRRIATHEESWGDCS